MIQVIIQNNHDLLMRCGTCGANDRIDFRLKEAPFWYSYVGWHLLGMIQHEAENHRLINDG